MMYMNKDQDNSSSVPSLNDAIDKDYCEVSIHFNSSDLNESLVVVEDNYPKSDDPLFDNDDNDDTMMLSDCILVEGLSGEIEEVIALVQQNHHQDLQWYIVTYPDLDVNQFSTTSPGINPIIAACMCGALACLQLLMKHGGNVAIVSPSGLPAMFYAIKYKQFDLAIDVIQQHPTLVHPQLTSLYLDHQGNDMLLMCAQHIYREQGNDYIHSRGMKLFRLLLQYGAFGLNHHNHDGKTVELYALHHKMHEIMQIILEFTPKRSNMSTWLLEKSLFFIHEDNPTSLQAFYDLCIDQLGVSMHHIAHVINKVNTHGLSMIHATVLKSDPELLEVLIKYGGDMTSCYTKDQKTILMFILDTAIRQLRSYCHSLPSSLTTTTTTTITTTTTSSGGEIGGDLGLAVVGTEAKSTSALAAVASERVMAVSSGKGGGTSNNNLINSSSGGGSNRNHTTATRSNIKGNNKHPIVDTSIISASSPITLSSSSSFTTAESWVGDSYTSHHQQHHHYRQEALINALVITSQSSLLTPSASSSSSALSSSLHQNNRPLSTPTEDDTLGQSVLSSDDLTRTDSTTMPAVATQHDMALIAVNSPIYASIRKHLDMVDYILTHHLDKVQHTLPHRDTNNDTIIDYLVRGDLECFISNDMITRIIDANPSLTICPITHNTLLMRLIEDDIVDNTRYIYIQGQIRRVKDMMCLHDKDDHILHHSHNNHPTNSATMVGHDSISNDSADEVSDNSAKTHLNKVARLNNTNDTKVINGDANGGACSTTPNNPKTMNIRERIKNKLKSSPPMSSPSSLHHNTTTNTSNTTADQPSTIISHAICEDAQDDMQGSLEKQPLQKGEQQQQHQYSLLLTLQHYLDWYHRSIHKRYVLVRWLLQQPLHYARLTQFNRIGWCTFDLLMIDSDIYSFTMPSNGNTIDNNNAIDHFTKHNQTDDHLNTINHGMTMIHTTRTGDGNDGNHMSSDESHMKKKANTYTSSSSSNISTGSRHGHKQQAHITGHTKVNVTQSGSSSSSSSSSSHTNSSETDRHHNQHNIKLLSSKPMAVMLIEKYIYHRLLDIHHDLTGTLYDKAVYMEEDAKIELLRTYKQTSHYTTVTNDSVRLHATKVSKSQCINDVYHMLLLPLHLRRETM